MRQESLGKVLVSSIDSTLFMGGICLQMDSCSKILELYEMQDT